MEQFKDWLFRRWTLVIVGKESGSKTSLETLFRFRSQQEALARASRMNAQEAGTVTESLTRVEAERR